LAMESRFERFNVLERVPEVDAASASALHDVAEMAKCESKAAWPMSFHADDGVKKFSARYMKALSASLSHLTAIYKAFDDGAETALILEDDATPDLIPTWTKEMDEYILKLPEDWTIVQLSAIGSEDEARELFYEWQRHRASAPGRLLSTLPKGFTEIGSTQAYLISRRGMKKLVDSYRAPRTGRIDLCKATCVEFDECFLADGVGLNSDYRIATPPLFVPRAKDANKGDAFDSARQIFYSWAVTLSFTKGKAANIRMDATMIRDVLDEGLKLPLGLKPNSFHEQFNYHCQLNHGGGSTCSLKKGSLLDQQPPKHIVVPTSDEGVTDKDAHESTLGRVRLPTAMDGVSFTSAPFMAMYIIAAFASMMFIGTFVHARNTQNEAKEQLPILPPGYMQTIEYYA